MQRISLEIYTSALEAVNIITDIVDHKVELSIPAGSVLLDNILNLKIILAQAKKVGKEVDFVTDDEFGKNLIDILRGEKDEVVVGESMVKSNPARLPIALKLPSMRFPVTRLPKIALDFRKLGLVIPVAIVLMVVLGFLFLSRQHKAEVTLYFSPQVLTKSVGVKVGDGLKTDLDKKVLAGLKIAGSIDRSLTSASTGIELEGEKAKGKVTLYNSILEAVIVKKGTQLTYKTKDLLYVYTTQEEVTVPAGVNTLAIITKGTAEVSVMAEAIGSAYNIKKDKELSVKGYKSSELTASSAEDFKGGSSKEVKVVTQADLTKLEQDLIAYVLKSPANALKTRVLAGYALVDKSERVTSKNVVLNNKVGDKKDQFGGSITAQVEGLSYSRNELADFMGKLSQNVVPQGFEFHSYNKDLQVDILGNTEKTVLSPTEADLQVTFKFFITPKINKQKVFDKIAGLSVEDAVNELDKISDITRTELNLKPNFLFFKKVPTKESAVDIQIKIEE
ncbi:MAG: baseplate J/gp47 family protein [Patescibacteria group bacterium]